MTYLQKFSFFVVWMDERSYGGGYSGGQSCDHEPDGPRQREIYEKYTKFMKEKNKEGKT